MNFVPTMLICGFGTLYLFITTGLSVPTIIGIVCTLFVLANCGDDLTTPWNRRK